MRVVISSVYCLTDFFTFLLRSSIPSLPGFVWVSQAAVHRWWRLPLIPELWPNTTDTSWISPGSSPASRRSLKQHVYNTAIIMRNTLSVEATFLPMCRLSPAYFPMINQLHFHPKPISSNQMTTTQSVHRIEGNHQKSDPIFKDQFKELTQNTKLPK